MTSPKKPSIPVDKLRRLGVDQDFEDIALKQGASVADIFGKSRQPHVVRARREAMWLMWTKYNWSYSTVGEFFDRDHTTVMEAIAKHKKENNL